MIGSRRWSPVILAAVLLCGAGETARAQRPDAREEPDYEEFNVPYDGRFTFVRLRFTPLRGWSGGGGFWGRRNLWWDHDYPRAERNLTRILAELTALDPYVGGGNILALDDPELFKYPVAYLCEPGYWTLTAAEAENLRAYLQKGGFLIVDDFGGPEWFNFEERMREVLPGARPIPLDPSHPVFHSFFAIESLDMLDSYRGRAVFYGIFEDNDPTGRLMVVVNYNADIGDYWEWSDTGFVPIELSNEAYKLGVNYFIYAMTH